MLEEGKGRSSYEMWRQEILMVFGLHDLKDGVANH